MNMLTYSKLNAIFPKELVIYIGEFNPEHKEKMKSVFDELHEYHKVVYCDNDMCEKPFDIDDAYVSNMAFSKHDFYFCCEDCQSYGEWSIHYDYRKSRRSFQHQP